MLCAASRLLNRLTGGRRGEMLCTRAHREGWTLFVRCVDAAFELLRGEVNHCRSCYEWERDA